MLLDRLEILGFKSFAKRTQLRFSSGITAVVGPNGCGKSNIADAVRWALGEQNVRNLRGKNLEDVIFKGTREMKPAGLAEITLHLDNQEQRLATEYAQVAIQRRAFRSGESEFRINKAPCRLKDIRGLFLDTGLGNAQYAVIEREMIDEVLADRDEARRVLIDETAGITRYKQRRRETHRKLEGVERDLERVEDALEIEERQVRSLAYQMGRARRYKRLSERIRRLDVALARWKWQELDEAAAGDTSRFQEEERQRARLQTQLRGLEAEQEEKRLRLLELDRELAAARETRQETEERLAASREESLVRAERRKALTERIAELGERIEGAQATLAQSQERLAAIAPDGERLTRELEEKRRAADEVQAQWRKADEALRRARSELAEHQQMHIEQVRLRSQTDHRLQSLEGRLADLDLQQEKLAAQREALTERRRDLRDALGRLDDQRRRLEQEHEHLDERRDVLQAQREANEGGLRGTADRLSRIADEAARGESRLNLLEEQARTYEGYGEAVARLLAERESLPGVLGAASELIAVEGDWAQRLTPALQELTEWIVTRTEEDAWGAIDWLRASGLGQVTFVALETLRDLPSGLRTSDDRRAERARAALPDGVLTARVEEAEPLAAYLRARLVPVQSRAEVAPASDRAPDARWVTPAGEVIDGAGWIGASGGGSVEERLWTRPQEIAALQARLGELEEERRAVESERTQMTVRQREIEEAFDALSQEESALAARNKTVDRERLQREAEDRVIREELDRLEQEGRQLDQRREEARGQIETLRQDQTRVEQQEGSSDAVLREAHEEVERLGGVKDEVGQHLSERRMAVVMAEAALEDLRKQIRHLENEIESAHAAIEEGVRGRDAAAEEIAQNEARLEELRTQEGDLVALCERRAEAVNRLAHDRGRREDALAAIEQQLRDRHRELSVLEDSLRHDEVKLARYEAERARLAERVREHYDVDLASLSPVPPPRSGEERREGEGTEAPAEADGETSADTAADADTAASDATPADAAQAAVEAALAAERSGKRPHRGRPDADDPWGGMTLEEAQASLEQARRDRDRLGPVNQLAIEEYEEKREHVAFVKKQRDDLNESRTALLDAIERINIEARRLFEETFGRLQENFARTFGTLFPGGEAHLRLSGSDPLEADIEIMARPRGKRLSSINLLSSGERALTATALLFALYLVKPSPFCVLDEVDAPLDDANIDRFLALLQSFSDKTQFIVITHNKRTMEVADCLYGVTMQEPGISKIVSVRLEGGELVTEGGDGERAVLQGMQANE